MRWIIILLILINGGYFVWQHYYVAATSGNAGHVAEQGQEYDTLVLLSDLTDDRKELLGIVNSLDKNKAAEKLETKTPDATAKSESMAKDTQAKNNNSNAVDTKKIDAIQKDVVGSEKVDTTLTSNAKYCYVIGPIKTKSKISRISKHIRSMGLEITKVRKTVKKVPSHWIYLSGYKTEAEAKKGIARLASKGMKDTQLIKRNATSFVISVGLFSTKSGADDRLKTLEDFGFTPQASMVTANKSLYWIDLKYKDGDKVDTSLLQSLIKGMKDTKVEEASCK